MMMRKPDFVDECYAGKDLSLLKKLTLVIPTYNRNYYLSRCLWYHAHFPFGEIIVADSSPEEKKVVNRETVAKVREIFGANVRYLEYEPETEKYGGDIYRKWGDAVQHVETEYSQISTDKEFLIPTSLIKSILYLEQNTDYIASDARNYFITRSKNNKKEDKYIFIQRRQDRHSEINNNPLKRFVDAFTDTAPISNCLIPSVMRSDCRKEVSKYIRNDSVNDIRFGELVLAFFGHLRGKFYYNKSDISLIRDVSEIYSLKNSKRKNSSESSTTRYPTYLDYYNNNNLHLFDSFREALIINIAEKTELSVDDAKLFVSNNYTNKYFLRYYLERKSIISIIYNNYKGIVDTIWGNLPMICKKIFNRLSQIIFNKFIPLNDSEYVSPLSNPELNVIIELVKSTIKYHDDDIVIIP